MPIPCIDIVGFLVEKIKNKPTNRNSFDKGFNQCCDLYGLMIDRQGSVKLTLNREKLATVIWVAERGDSVPVNEQAMVMEQCYRYADAIISQEHTLIEVVKENK